MNKRMPKKLVLATETLRNLTERDLQQAGGGTVAFSNCAICQTAASCSLCAACN
jgi:hypothetical protein